MCASAVRICSFVNYEGDACTEGNRHAFKYAMLLNMAMNMIMQVIERAAMCAPLDCI